MGRIDEIYFTYKERSKYNEEQEEAFEKIQDMLGKFMNVELEFAIFHFGASSEQHGFQDGFRYAMQLMKECGL